LLFYVTIALSINYYKNKDKNWSCCKQSSVTFSKMDSWGAVDNS